MPISVLYNVNLKRPELYESEQFVCCKEMRAVKSYCEYRYVRVSIHRSDFLHITILPVRSISFVNFGIRCREVIMCTMFCHSVQGFRSFSTLNIICIYCMWCCRIRSVQAVQSRKSRLQKCTYAVNTGGVTRGWGAAWPWTAYSQIHSVQWINVWIIHSPLFFWTEMRRMASLNGPWVQKKKIKMPLIIVSVVLYTCKTSSPHQQNRRLKGSGMALVTPLLQ